MKILDSLKFPFQGPHAWPNIGCVAVCFLIPIIGPIVASGFQCSLEKHLLTNPDAIKFDFNKFGYYLRRGLIPFVIALIATMLLMFVVFAFVFGGILLAASTREEVIVVLAIVLAVLFWLATTVLFGLFLTPLIFKAGLEQQFGSAFSLPFLAGYLRRVGLAALGSQLLLMLITMPLLIIMCLPFIQYAVFAWLMLMQSHLQVQLYHLYLERGGTPFNIPTEFEEPGFPVLQPNDPSSP